MRFQKPAVLFLALCTAFSLRVPVGAATTREQIESIQSEKAGTESSLAETQARIDALEGLKGDLEAYLTELNAQYEELNTSLKDLTRQSEEKQKELIKAKADLKATKRQEAEQYAAMKLRISYMYENGDTSCLAALFSAESFADFLNRAENVMMINQYDREMLAKYEKTRKKAAQKKSRVEDEQKAIDQLKEESRRKREEIQQLENSTEDEIAAYQDEINGEQSEARNLLELVNSQAEELDSLMARAEAEQAAEEKAQAEAEARAAAEAEAARQAEAEQEQAQEEPEEPVQEESEPEEEPEEPQQEEPEEPQQEEPQEPAEETSESQETSSSGEGGTYLGNFKLTAYCNCAQCCGTAGNQTASGTWPTAGRTVAMAGVPFGTRLLINGNVYTVEDLGTPYGHVDIYCSSHSEALAFGLQYADVYQVN